MGLYITMYDLIKEYNGITSSTRSIPITYFYNIGELVNNIFKCIIRAVNDFVGNGIYGYKEDYSKIALFIYAFDDNREFENFARVVNIGFKNKDEDVVYISVSKYILIDLGIPSDEFVKSLNMEMKLSNNLNKNLIYIIE